LDIKYYDNRFGGWAWWNEIKKQILKICKKYLEKGFETKATPPDRLEL
jgi:hypothetical protein